MFPELFDLLGPLRQGGGTLSWDPPGIRVLARRGSARIAVLHCEAWKWWPGLRGAVAVPGQGWQLWA